MFTEAIKPIKNLDELKEVQAGNIISMGQLIIETIPVLCIEKIASELRCLGEMDRDVIIEYNFPIEKVVGFNEDGSIIVNYREASQYFDKGTEEYNTRKQILIKSGKWEEKIK
jgi:hypothetical protein